MRTNALAFFFLSVALAAAAVAGDGAPKIDPKGDPGSIEEAVRYTTTAEISIAVVDVQEPRVFTPSQGPDGTACKLGPESRILWRGKQGPAAVGDEIALYPKTEEKKVILILHADGNWLPYDKAVEVRIRAALKKLGLDKGGDGK